MSSPSQPRIITRVPGQGGAAAPGAPSEDPADERMIDEVIEETEALVRRYPDVPHVLAVRPPGWPREEPAFATELDELRWELRRIRAIDVHLRDGRSRAD